jgi:hypothetical protein
MLLAVVLILAGLVLALGIVRYLRAIPDDLTARLAEEPGYDLALPGAEQLTDQSAKSIGGAGARRTRTWGVHGTPEQLAAATDELLAGLGYERIEALSDSGGGGVIGRYRREEALISVTWAGLPHRIPGGRFIASGYDFVAYTTIANGEVARRDA